MFLRILCATFALLLFSEACAQDTVYVTLKTCPEQPAPNDPSIMVGKKTATDCATGAPTVFSVTDRQYGHKVVSMPLRKIPDATARVIEPAKEDIYRTHRPCRIAYKDENGKLEGMFIEWLLLQGEPCNGLPMGAYYRVYLPDGRVCVRPEGGCIARREMRERARHRFELNLRIAYANLGW